MLVLGWPGYLRPQQISIVTTSHPSFEVAFWQMDQTCRSIHQLVRMVWGFAEHGYLLIHHLIIIISRSFVRSFIPSFLLSYSRITWGLIPHLRFGSGCLLSMTQVPSDPSMYARLSPLLFVAPRILYVPPHRWSDISVLFVLSHVRQYIPYEVDYPP